MNEFMYKGKYEVYNNCYFQVGRYANGNLAVEIWSAEDGPITKVTVNPDFKVGDDYIVVKDYSENEGMADFLKSMEIIAEDPVRTVVSGWVMIPIYRLTEKGKEIFLK